MYLVSAGSWIAVLVGTLKPYARHNAKSVSVDHSHCLSSFSSFSPDLGFATSFFMLTMGLVFFFSVLPWSIVMLFIWDLSSFDCYYLSSMNCFCCIPCLLILTWLNVFFNSLVDIFFWSHWLLRSMFSHFDVLVIFPKFLLLLIFYFCIVRF